MNIIKAKAYQLKVKGKEFFKGEELKVIKSVSGHTFKKDLYPSYKAKRENDEYLGMYRSVIKEVHSDDITLVENLETDDVLIMINELHRDDSVVFSDDKDLHKYCKYTCGLNEDKVINSERYGFIPQLAQLISGDTTDNIKGCPNYGEKKSETYLKRNGYDIYNVVKLYRDNGVSIDDCLKNLVLIHPVAIGILEANIYTQEEIVESILKRDVIDYGKVFYQIHNIIAILSEIVKEVYKSGEENADK